MLFALWTKGLSMHDQGPRDLRTVRTKRTERTERTVLLGAKRTAWFWVQRTAGWFWVQWALGALGTLGTFSTERTPYYPQVQWN